LADSGDGFDEARMLRPPQAEAWPHHIAFGPRGNHKVLTMPATRSGRRTGTGPGIAIVLLLRRLGDV
jgi:hypothetical protein